MYYHYKFQHIKAGMINSHVLTAIVNGKYKNHQPVTLRNVSTSGTYSFLFSYLVSLWINTDTMFSTKSLFGTLFVLVLLFMSVGKPHNVFHKFFIPFFPSIFNYLLFSSQICPTFISNNMIARILTQISTKFHKHGP